MPKVFRNDRSRWQRFVLVAAGAGILASIAFLLVGSWGLSVGVFGLLAHLAMAVGFLIFSAAIGGIFVVLAADLRRSRRAEARLAGFDRWLWLKELGVVALNVVVYGGSALLSLGALSSLDGAGAGQIAVVVVVWAVCIAAAVLYRRHRKRHRVAYDAVGPPIMTTSCAAVALFCAFVGADAGCGALVDLIKGPRAEVCVLSGVEQHRPSARYGALRQTVISCEFTTAGGENVRVEVNQGDVPALRAVEDAAEAGEAVRLTFYPHSRTFVSADPVPAS